MSTKLLCDWCKELIENPGINPFGILKLQVIGGDDPGFTEYHLCYGCLPSLEGSLEQTDPVK